MDLAFFEFLGQVGATVTTVAFSLFVAYLLYLKEQRDRIGTQIIMQKREIFSVFRKLLETPIPGVSQSLTSKRPTRDQKLKTLSIAEWASGVSWVMRLKTAQIKRDEVWDEVRKGLENLVRGILPDGVLPPIAKDSELFRGWAKDFVENTEHIRWFTHEYADHSWAKSLIGYMRKWEEKYPNPVLRSQDVGLLLDRIMILRQLLIEDLLLESDYQRLKVENTISNYKIVIGGFLVMGLFSIFLPFIIMLFPPSNGKYDIYIQEYGTSIYVQHLSVFIFALFLFSSMLVMYILLRSAKK